MGADIYLQSEFENNNARWNRAVAKRDQYPRGSAMYERLQRDVKVAYSRMYGVGYFRDSYNSYGLFAQTDLSWWQDVVPLLNEDGCLPIENARKLADMVRSAKLDLSAAERVAAEQKDAPPEEGWEVFYETERAQLLTLIERSIELGEPLECSL